MKQFTSRLSCFTFTHSPWRGDLSRRSLAQSVFCWAKTGTDETRHVHATTAAAKSLDRVMDGDSNLVCGGFFCDACPRPLAGAKRIWKIEIKFTVPKCNKRSRNRAERFRCPPKPARRRNGRP